jgi:hypothetical protein
MEFHCIWSIDRRHSSSTSRSASDNVLCTSWWSDSSDDRRRRIINYEMDGQYDESNGSSNASAFRRSFCVSETSFFVECGYLKLFRILLVEKKYFIWKIFILYRVFQKNRHLVIFWRKFKKKIFF